MKKHIVCFGDSNTHGYCADPADTHSTTPTRFSESERWPCLLQQAMGEEYLVLEEGLSGRTTVFSDPLYEGLSGLDYINPCLMSHEPVALLIIMLGTNDTKARFGVSAECISLGMDRLVRKAMETNCWLDKPNVLVVAPPPIGIEMESSSVGATMGQGCADKAAKLAECYAASAKLNGWEFLDAAGCEFNQVDYMHLTREGHAQLAQKLREKIKAMGV